MWYHHCLLSLLAGSSLGASTGAVVPFFSLQGVGVHCVVLEWFIADVRMAISVAVTPSRCRVELQLWGQFEVDSSWP